MNGRRIVIGFVAVAAAMLTILGVRRFFSGGEDNEDVVTDVGVHVTTVRRDTIFRHVTAYGYVDAAPATRGRQGAAAVVSTFVGGVLTAIDCIEGGRVQKGAVLFRLDSRMVEVNLQKAQQEVDFAEKAFDRQQALLPANGTSRRAYQEAQQRLDAARSSLAAARTELEYHTITAPITGTVARLNARLGQFVDANTVLAEVVDLGRLVVSADVPVREGADLKVGMPVLMGADRTADRGELTTVGRSVDPRTGTFRVQAAIRTAGGYAPGQFTQIRIVAERHAGVLVVPEASVVSRAGEGSWIVVVDGQHATRRSVTVGLRDGGLVEVSGEGLAEGMTIVTDEAYSLPEETRIHIVER